MTNGEMIQKVFNCEVCEPIIEDDIIHVIFADKKDSAIGFDWSWWNAEYKEPQSFKWCTDCREYDQEKHCCHRWSKVIRDTVEEMKQEQEPKTGHWISHGEHCKNLGVIPSGLGAYEWCSNCDCGIDVREWHRNHYNYCPNCGAKMVEPQESEGKE